MIRTLIGCVLALTLLTSCAKKAAENKEAVREAIVQRLQKNAALDTNALTVDVTDVTFKGDEAQATVSIKPKNAPDQGMTMGYVLARHGEKWEVTGTAGGHGGGAMAVPPGEAPHGGSSAPEPKGALGDAPTAGSGSQTLPPGHPPVTQQSQQK